MLVVSASQRFSIVRALSRPIRALNVGAPPAGVPCEDSWTAFAAGYVFWIPVDRHTPTALSSSRTCLLPRFKHPFVRLGTAITLRTPHEVLAGGSVTGRLTRGRARAKRRTSWEPDWVRCGIDGVEELHVHRNVLDDALLDLDPESVLLETRTPEPSRTADPPLSVTVLRLPNRCTLAGDSRAPPLSQYAHA